MQRNRFHRAVSFCLAAVMTLAVMGSIDELARIDPPASALAQATATRA